MRIADVNTTIIEGYLRLLSTLSLKDKLTLISKLTLSIKKDVFNEKTSFYKAFGAWDSKKSADELINEIQDSRSFDRQIEKL